MKAEFGLPEGADGHGLPACLLYWSRALAAVCLLTVSL